MVTMKGQGIEGLTGCVVFSVNGICRRVLVYRGLLNPKPYYPETPISLNSGRYFKL